MVELCSNLDDSLGPDDPEADDPVDSENLNRDLN